jgi:hypothetical protein
MVLVWGCAACAPPEPEPAVVDFAYTDRYTEMQAICGWAEYRATYAEEVHSFEGPNDMDIPAYPSEACVDRVLEDLHVDVEAFLAFDGLESPYGIALDGGPVWHDTFLGNPLSAGRALGLLDHGALEAQRGADLISGGFMTVLDEVAFETGDTGLAAAQYNFLSAAFERVVPADDDGTAAYRPSDGTLLYYEAYGPDTGNLAVMMHEGWHARMGAPHVTCDGNAGIPDAEHQCDVDYEGAFGFGISALAATQAAYTDPWMRDMLRSDAESQMRMINGCLVDGEGLGDTWEVLLDTVFWTE